VEQRRFLCSRAALLPCLLLCGGSHLRIVHRFSALQSGRVPAVRSCRSRNGRVGRGADSRARARRAA